MTIPMDHEALYRDFGFVPGDPSWPQVFTSMFLHGGIWHVLGNLFFLWMFGDNVEDVLGPLGFVGVYFVSGIAAVGAHLAINTGSTVPIIGASGAISGVVGAYFAFFPKAPAELVVHILRWEVATFSVTTIGAVGAWFGEQLVLALLTMGTGLSEYVGIAFWAHIGGLLAGVSLGAVLRLVGYVDRYTGSRGVRNPLFGYVSLIEVTTGREPDGVDAAGRRRGPGMRDGGPRS